MKKVFLLHEELGNGHYFEGENNVKLYATREQAVERMKQLYEEDLQMFKENYEDEFIYSSIDIENDYASRFWIDGCDCQDYCECSVTEEEIFGDTETMVAHVLADHIMLHDYEDWKAMDYETISNEDGVETYTLAEFQCAFNHDEVSDQGYIFFY